MLYELTGVTRQYRRGDKTIDALTGIDLAIAEGEFVAIQGRTGSGKTTLLQLLGALDRPSTGTVVFDGQDLTTLDQGSLTDLRARVFGFVFQAFNLIPTLNARENVEVALVPWGLPRDERRARAQAALTAVGLADRSNHLPSQLSGGEQQRVAIARALVREPRVVLADEPTGDLDETTRDEVVDILQTLWWERGLTLIIVTHDSTVAARSSRRIWLDAGRVVSVESRPGDTRASAPARRAPSVEEVGGR